MPRKKFEAEEDANYDPFAAENKRAAIRAAISEPEERSGGGGEPTLTLTPPAKPSVKPAPKKPPGKATAKPAEKLAEKAPEAPAKPEEPVRPTSVPELQKTDSRAANDLARSTQRQSVQKRFRVTENEEQEFEAFVLRLRNASSSKVDFSVISRALWTVVQHGESELLETLRKTAVPKRPGKHDVLANAEYEERWVRILSTALRRAAPMK